MIVYHGSNFLFDYPEYSEIAANTSEGRFPLGLWASTTRAAAERFGPHVYEMELDAAPVLIRDGSTLNRPRHIHMRDGRDVLLTGNRDVIVINFDAIVDFRYLGDRNLVEVGRNMACM